MDTTAQEFAQILATRGPDGGLLYSDRDLTVGIAFLAALERQPMRKLGAARPHVARLLAWARVGPKDDDTSAARKVDAYLESNPIHPALMKQLRRVLRAFKPRFVEVEVHKRLGNTWSATAPRPEDITASRGSVLRFMTNGKKTS